MTDIEKAREWANRTLDDDPFPAHEGVAAKVIQSLPDQWVDAEKLREALDGWSLAGKALRETDLGKQLEALIPTPKLPTLADMTPEEREACRWMQCKVETDDEDTIGVIWMIWSNRVHIIFQSGIIFDAESRKVTPLPDLPKLEWPGSEVVETPVLPEGMRLADHEEYGRVVVSPKVDTEGDHKAFYSHDSLEAENGASWGYVNKNELTFLGGDQRA